MKKVFSLLLAIGMAASLQAQDLEVAGTYTGEVPAGLRLHVFPAENMSVKPDSMLLNGGKLSARTTPSGINIYKLVGATRQRQIIIPFYMKDGAAKLSLSFSDKGEVRIVNADADTRALVAFNDLYASRAKAMWMEGKEMETARLKDLVVGFSAVADSIVKADKPSETTAQYLRIWAASLTYDNISSLKFATGRDAASLGIDREAETKHLAKAIDCDMAASFDAAPRVALEVVGNGSLEEKLTALDKSFQNAGLKSRAQAVMLSQYISSFDYANNYEAGLENLSALTQRFHLDAKYLQEFKVRKSSIPGTPFPENVTLEDLNGQKVDFSQYRGSYVFIDMWASWCVPCIKEIPYLKQVEKELEGKNIKFVSISIDTNEAAWKKKVADLGLEGEQLISKGNQLGEALNVRGIPFFLIYDKEGKLYRYNAPRPSDVRLKQILTELGN